MTRTKTSFRAARYLIVCGLVLGFGLLACKKQPFVQIVEQTLYLGMPASIDRLISVDVAQLRLTDGFGDTAKGIEESSPGQVKAVMDSLRQKIGLDPWTDLNQIIIGTHGPADRNNPAKNMIFIVRGNFQNPQGKLEKLRDWLADEYLTDVKFTPGMHPSGARKFQISGKSQYDVKISYELNFAFPSETLMLFSFTAPMVSDTLDVISGQLEGIQQNKDWMEMLKRPNIGAAIWGIGTVSSTDVKDLVAAMPESAEQLRGLKQIFFDANFSPDLAVRLGLICENIDAATKLADNIRQSYEKMKTGITMLLTTLPAPETAKLVDNLKIMNELETVKLSVTMSANDKRLLQDEWQKLSEKMKSAKTGQPMPGKGLPPSGTTPPKP